MATRAASGIAVFVSVVVLGASSALARDLSTVQARELTFEDRVKAQKAIEQVYWDHRIWPKENREAKPPLSAVLSDAQIRARVEDYLKKSNVLAETWSRPITAAQLQAEMERMAAQTKAPDVLRELFAALNNDPVLIAETLARQTLAHRLIHNWYTSDDRFHGDVRRKAEAALAGVSGAVQLKTLGAEYTETTWKLKRDGDAPSPEKPNEIALDAAEWQERLGRLASIVGIERGAGGGNPGVMRGIELASDALPASGSGGVRRIEAGSSAAPSDLRSSSSWPTAQRANQTAAGRSPPAATQRTRRTR